MRRFWFLLLAITTILVIALPAGAGKPIKPPKPPSSAPVAATLDAEPIWVHEDGDDILYSVTVQNKTRDGMTFEIEHPAGTVIATGVIDEPRGVAEFPDLFSYPVTDDDVKADVDIVGTVTVTYEGGHVIAETSTVMDPVDGCDFDALVAGEVCIWKPLLTGIWEVSVEPVPVPTRPTNLMVTMRDGVPGNWCTLLDDGGGGVIQERWLPKSPGPVVLNVYLPSNGVCLTGGHGVCTEPDCFFAVGNPESFYLYTSFDGTATLTHNP